MRNLLLKRTFLTNLVNYIFDVHVISMFVLAEEPLVVVVHLKKRTFKLPLSFLCERIGVRLGSSSSHGVRFSLATSACRRCGIDVVSGADVVARAIRDVFCSMATKVAVEETLEYD